MIPSRNSYQTGRLTAAPHLPTLETTSKTGLHPLGLDPDKDGLLYVPLGYDPALPAALAVLYHGSGGNPEQGQWLLQQYADAANLILLAPASRKYTWDVIVSDSFGPDAWYTDQALAHVFSHYAIDPGKIAVGGFSDGASYALCMGLTNGDLFTHVIAFSPGFGFSREKTGQAAVFLSHGQQDPILPIDPCSRKVYRELKDLGLEVNYLEFEGEHEIPGPVSAAAVEWFLGKKIG
ncbi:alpha/beta hydrolase [Rufibacter glacialis]|uniref:Alpha/beta hydrolase n=1 Tax=Rufibacter glacialis TaxID=1259555 RepID=A0A5M8QBD6_9BACT|nr:alpha/beta hydrolase-fold protein [Rufibacter glacialis]KAA6432413.1 phospholipase [Rufibacter glacialis]GGK78463.1 serine esterase [Rufibacter glacialis]